MAAPERVCFIEATHPELGRIFAAVDGSARFTTAELRPSRFAASLAPFPDEAAALFALARIGATVAE